jgi:hypothetical protein
MSVHILNTKQSIVSNFPRQQRHTTNGFCRVTKHRRCRVCGKSDWCGYSSDEQTSICMRVSNGSKGTSRNGGNIYYHGRIFLVGRSRFNSKRATPPIEIAPINIRNAVYEELIRKYPAHKYFSQLIEGPHGLLSRGLGKSQLQIFGALPRTQKERSSLARILNKFVTARFPENALRNFHAGVIGVPGFWQDESGIVQLWKDRDYNLCSSSPTGTARGEFKPANFGFTEMIFRLAKKSIDGFHRHLNAAARAREHQSTLPSQLELCRRARQSSLLRVLLKLRPF